MIKVISFKICPFVQRVTSALEAKNIPYEIEYISLSDKPKWFLDISPTGQVPVLITESKKAIFESDAIIEYIEDEFGPVVEGLSNEVKAFERAWSYQASKHYLTQCSTMRSGDKETLIKRTEKLAKAFARAENILSESRFFHGDTIGKVDIAWIPLLHRAHIIKEKTCYDLLEGYPKVQKWQSELMKEGIIKKTVSSDFEEKFCEFYLSDKTYLGSGEDCQSESDHSCSSGSCC